MDTITFYRAGFGRHKFTLTSWSAKCILGSVFTMMADYLTWICISCPAVHSLYYGSPMFSCPKPHPERRVNTNHDIVWYQSSFSLNGIRVIISKHIWAWTDYPRAAVLPQSKAFCPFVEQYTWKFSVHQESYKHFVKTLFNEFISLVTQI